MKKTFMLFAAMVMLASVSIAQKNVTKEGGNLPMLQATRFAPAKLAKKTDAKGVRKDAGNPIWENTMSYCLDDAFYNNVGTSTEGDTVYWAIRIESAALVGRNNLTNVEFFVVEPGTYKVNVYSGAEPTGTALFNQTVTIGTADTMAWKTITFANPITITQGQDLWVVISNSDVAYPASGVQGGNYENGKLISIDGIEWMNVAEAGVDVTWMIRATSDTYTVLPPQLTLQGPSVVRGGDTAVYQARSANADAYEWTLDAEYYDVTTTPNVATVVWETAGQHQVIVKASNGAGDTYDTLEVEVLDCNNTPMPYVPNFAGGLGCWTSRSDSTDQSGWFASVDMFEEDPEGQVLSMSAESVYGIFMMDFPVDNWLFSPVIEMPASDEYEIAWQVKPFSSTYDGDHYGVYVINNNDTILLYEESLTGMSEASFTQRMAIIPDSISGDFQVAFRHFNSVGGYVIILDSIQVRELSAPVLTLAGPVEAVNGTAVTFTATSPNASSFVWTVDGNSVNESSNVLTHTFTTDGIHNVSVVASNNAGDTEDSILVDVYTCNAIEEFPFTQDFEGSLRCWNMISADPANDNRFGVYEDSLAYAGDYDFRFSSYSRAADYNQYLISPELEIPTSGVYMLKFMYKAYNALEKFRVMASSTTNEVAAFTTVLGTYESPETAWTEVAFLLPAGTKYVAINYYGDYQYYLYVDNITVKELDVVPTVAIEGPASAEINTDVTFVANAPLATSFAWTVDGVDANTTGNTLTTSFATAGSHTVSVVATNSFGSAPAVTATIDAFVCEAVSAPWTEDFEGNIGCWRFFVNDEGSDGIELFQSSQYAHSGSFCLLGNYNDDFNVDQWAVSPVINMPANAANYKLSFFIYTTSYQGINSSYEVRLSNGGTAVADFSTLLLSESEGNGNYRQRTIDMSSYAGQSFRIAFRNVTAAGGDALLIDDIELSNTVGINEVENNVLSVSPNPASTMVAISAAGIEGNVTVQIVDLNGRVMMQQQGAAQNFRFDVSNLAQGAYFVRMTGENVNAVRKLIVK